MLKLAVVHINRLRPRFLLVSGDLINAFPSGPNASPHAALGEIASLKEVLREVSSDIPIIFQPGNHDIAQIPTPKDIALYRERFGDDYYSFWVGGVFYLSINSQYYMDDAESKELRAAQDKWVEEELAASKAVAKHIVLLSHVPPFVGKEDEEQGWATWERGARKKMLSLAAEAGAKLWLCGHFHGQAHCWSEGGVEIVVTKSCCTNINWIAEAGECATKVRPDFAATVGNPPVVCDSFHAGMRIVRVKEDGFQHRWFTLNEVPNSLDEAFEFELKSKDDLHRHKVLGATLGLHTDHSREIAHDHKPVHPTH